MGCLFIILILVLVPPPFNIIVLVLWAIFGSGGDDNDI